MKEPLYEFEGVRVLRGGRAILDVDRFAIEAGERVAVVGANGAGKTTLLRLMAFLVRPSEGTLAFRGRILPPASPPAPSLRRSATLVMQAPYLFTGTVLKNASYAPYAQGLGRGETARRAREALQSVGLSDFADRSAGTLSGGEAKRLAVARALAGEAEVLLMDEPTADVDEENRKRIEDLVVSVNRDRGRTVVISTHDKNQALRLASRIVALEKGRVVDAHPENVFRGEVREKAGALVFRTGEAELRVGEGAPGPATASLDPASVALSLSVPETSAKNVLRGRIVEVAEENGKVRVAVEAGTRIVAYVTPASATELALTVGSDVYAVFKAHAVKVIQ